MKRLFTILILFAPMAMAQTFTCSGTFNTSSSPCKVAVSFGSGDFLSTGTSSTVSGGNVQVIPTGQTHIGSFMNYQTAVNIQAFTTSFQFIASTWSTAFVIQNTTNTNGSGGLHASFAAGASCEAGFFQGFGTQPVFTNNVFALLFDQSSALGTSGSFSYSSAQIYQQTQSPCHPNQLGSTNWWSTPSISTSPVAINSPSGTANTTTGDVYQANISYDGANFNLCLIDVTLGNGTCNTTGTSGTGTFFQQTWSNVNIPSLVGANTAWIGIGGGMGNAGAPSPLQVNAWAYTVNTPPGSPALSTYTTQSYMGSSAAASPTFSPVAGSYGTSQSVTLSCSTPSSYMCYTLSATTPSLMPQVNSFGANTPVGGTAYCGVGTHYTGAITVSTSQTIYAMCGTTYTALPSNLVTAGYTIGGGGSATPVTCTPTSGSSGSSILVSCTNSNTGTFGACYSTTTTPVGNGAGTGCTTGTFLSGASPSVTIGSTVSSLQIIGISSTLSDSSANTYGPYTIMAGPSTPTVTGIVCTGCKLQ